VKLLVTGGGGYLGSEVARLALERGWDVAATKLRSEPPYGDVVPLDLRDDEAVMRTVRDVRPDVVIHTAYRQADEYVQGDVVDATRNVADAVRASGARLIALSTDLVFDGERDGAYVEDDETNPVSPYGAAKLESERIVAARLPDALVVRTALLYGKPGPQEALALRDDVVFFTDEIRSPIRVDDLAAALLELAGLDASGVLHVAGPEPVSRYDLARALAAAQGRDPDELRPAQSPGGRRARNVALDSSRAAAVLRTPIRAVGAEAPSPQYSLQSRHSGPHISPVRRNGRAAPICFVGGSTANVHDKEKQLQREVTQRVEASLPGVEVLALELSGSERFTVYVDHPQGVDHGLCQRVTDVLRDYLREYSVDVSSPGIERPVRKPQHFRNAVGRRVALRTPDRRVRGEVVAADDRAVRIGVDGSELEIPYESIVRGNLIDTESKGQV
jgi:dTDP-4-dehydrorhamnose reductase